MSTKTKNTLQRKILGSKDFEGSVDITDPCYDRDVWCRMDDVKIKNGSYVCVIWKYAKRIAIIGIYHNGKIPNQNSMEIIGSIGVDAGLAGFFHNKPDFDDKEWDKLCNKMSNRTAWLTKLGFWSESGYGDGVYGVYAGKDKNGVINALEIRFI